MDGMIDIEAARALVSDAALWPRVRGFLWNFASQIHPSHLSSLPLPAVPSLPAVSALQSSSRVSRWILAELSVDPCFHPFPSDDLSRLLLLDSDTLVAVARWLGALASTEALRRVTRGPDVAALKSSLPGIYPDVFSCTAYFAKTALPPSADPAPGAVQSHGFSLLFSFLSGLPSPLLRRLRLKLPADALPSNDQTVAPSNDPTVKRSNDQTIKLLLKLHFPEAFSLCCS